MKAPQGLDVPGLFSWLVKETERAVESSDVEKLKEILRFMEEYDGPLPDTGFEFFPTMLPIELYDQVYA